ncbi:MAG TPA: DUF6252 family protein [Bacteroidales bacterium]|nr:DUF6252 family protein [Bacteroidales bacterium]
MKELLIYVIVALTFIAGSCKKDTNDDGTPVATTKMSCKINGTTWSSITRVTQYYDNKFIISGTSMDGKVIIITILGDTQGTYNLQVGEFESGATYSPSALSPTDIYGSLSGSVVLTKVDKINKKISGTFQFTAAKANDLTNQISITNGEFTDLSYNLINN